MYDTFLGEEGDMPGSNSSRQPSSSRHTSSNSDFFVLKIFNTQFFMLVALTVIFILNNNVFYKSQMIFTINLIVMMFAFMYLAKYLDYDGSHILASLLQILLFYIAH